MRAAATRRRLHRLARGMVIALGCFVLAAQAELLEHDFELEGHPRSYLLYVPDGADRLEGPRPLVLVIHGGGGTARGMVRLTRSAFHALADRDGFYVAYPHALDRTWDFGEGDVSLARKVRVDDLAYFQDLLDRVAAAHPVDSRRVFATGISRGGQASYFLACRMPDRIRAIMPVAMPLPAFLEDDCRDGPAVGVAVVNGTRDPLVPYDGGQIEVFGRERGEVLPTDATLALWATRNGCSGGFVREVIDPADDVMDVHHDRWQDCRAPVELYRINGGGHTWPSGRQYLPRSIVGPVNRDLDAAALAWSFFSRFE